jgi:hypothetical protein
MSPEILPRCTLYVWDQIDVGIGEVQPHTFVKIIYYRRQTVRRELLPFPLYGDGNPTSKPQDVPNSKDAITVYYQHRLAGNNVSGKMKIQSTSTIAQMKHATSTFKEHLLKYRVHSNNAQLGPEEAVALGWIPGFHRAFYF